MAIKRRDDYSVNTIIGPHTSVNGDVDSGGFTRVDGSLRGNLSTKGRVVVGNNARMKSNVTGTSITIGGVVYGNVLASERVMLLTTGVVIGDIITRRIQADEGCIIHGKVTICLSDEKWNSAVSEFWDIQEVKSVLAGFSLRLDRAEAKPIESMLVDIKPPDRPEDSVGQPLASSNPLAFPVLLPSSLQQQELPLKDREETEMKLEALPNQLWKFPEHFSAFSSHGEPASTFQEPPVREDPPNEPHLPIPEPASSEASSNFSPAETAGEASYDEAVLKTLSDDPDSLSTQPDSALPVPAGTSQETGSEDPGAGVKPLNAPAFEGSFGLYSPPVSTDEESPVADSGLPGTEARGIDTQEPGPSDTDPSKVENHGEG
ncbi:MAG: polymer-forming cytoskeletal protein [Treponema sp.]|jgi:cytoskeletal protein CcmA (bactofilin family)|nr:polymer-forming cytoskeletal protein [Treponema sp.]